MKQETWLKLARRKTERTFTRILICDDRRLFAGGPRPRIGTTSGHGQGSRGGRGHRVIGRGHAGLRGGGGFSSHSAPTPRGAHQPPARCLVTWPWVGTNSHDLALHRIFRPNAPHETHLLHCNQLLLFGERCGIGAVTMWDGPEPYLMCPGFVRCGSSSAFTTPCNTQNS